MICLDTDLLISFGRRNPEAKLFIDGLEARNEEMATSIISACELFEGVYLSQKPREEEAKIQTILNRLTVLPLSHAASKKFGEIAADLRKKGGRIEDFDVLIAAIAITHDARLATRNMSHFERIPELDLVRW